MFFEITKKRHNSLPRINQDRVDGSFKLQCELPEYCFSVILDTNYRKKIGSFGTWYISHGSCIFYLFFLFTVNFVIIIINLNYGKWILTSDHYLLNNFFV